MDKGIVKNFDSNETADKLFQKILLKQEPGNKNEILFLVGSVGLRIVLNIGLEKFFQKAAFTFGCHFFYPKINNYFYCDYNKVKKGIIRI